MMKLMNCAIYVQMFSSLLCCSCRRKFCSYSLGLSCTDSRYGRGMGGGGLKEGGEGGREEGEGSR